MNKLSIALAVALAAVTTGCGTLGSGDKEVTYTTTNSVMHAAFSQARSTPVWDIIGNGTNTELTVKNFVRMTVYSPVSPIQLPSEQPGFWSGLFAGMFDTAKTLGPWGAIVGLGSRVTSTPASIKGATTVNVPAAATTP